MLDKGEFCHRKILSFYIDEVSDEARCCIDNLYMNHVMYADDICLMALSFAALQEFIDICRDFNVQK